MKLSVKPLKQKDAGRGLAAVDRAAMEELGLENGDYILIEGSEGRAIARVWPGYPDDHDQDVIRIDGQLRGEAQVGIDDRVSVEKADVKPAQSVTVALPQNLRIRGNIGPYIQDKLSGQAITQGQTIPFSLGFGPFSGNSGQRIPLRIAETSPNGTVIVAEGTEIEVSEKPAEEIVSEDGSETASTPSVTYEDIGGLDRELEQVREMIELPMRHPELFKQFGIDPPKGVLLHGPPGTGKTLIAKAVANEIDAHFETISGPEIMSKYYGESEEQLREIFDEAEENEPAIVFIDEIDSIAPKRDDTSGDVERRVVAQLLSLMDGLEERGQVTVIAATNRVDAIDPALRRGGRFDREIEIGVPDKEGRKEILQVHTRGMPLEDGIDLDTYAESTHGFVGSDLEIADEGGGDERAPADPTRTRPRRGGDRRRGARIAAGHPRRHEERAEGHRAVRAPRGVRRGPRRHVGERRRARGHQRAPPRDRPVAARLPRGVRGDGHERREGRDDVRPAGHGEDPAREGRRQRGPVELHLDQGPRTPQQVRRRVGEGRPRGLLEGPRERTRLSCSSTRSTRSRASAASTPTIRASASAWSHSSSPSSMASKNWRTSW